MNLTELTEILEVVFASNFVARYRAHVAHINIKGRNFYNDHKLLKKIYEYLEDQVDPLGEKLRTLGALVPDMLVATTAMSRVHDYGMNGTSEDLLRHVLDDVMTLIDVYHELRHVAEEVDYTDISNMADDAIGKLAKYKWQLEATLSSDDDFGNY
jgi:DNA-binding ferritin-like protein